MAYNVSQDFTNKLYSGESNFRAILTIGENTIDNDQIASISISSPIIDDSKQVFYVGSFISQKITIKFKNMDGIDVHSGDNVDLSIGQYVNNEWVDVPIGKFLVDDLAEDYFEKCEISCLDYAVKFKPNIDYSLCFTDEKATIKEILEYICDYFDVEIGDYPTINDDVEIGTYDSTVSGKQWISYIAELKGCNAKIDRLGRLALQPLKQPSNVPINALESASFELGEEFNITKVTFFDAVRNYTYGDDEGNTLFIRQDNPFITDTKVVQNIYDNLCAIKYSASGKSFDIEDADAHPINVNTIYGETSQETYSGKNLLNYNVNYAQGTTTTISGVTVNFNNDGSITLNGTMNANNIEITGTDNKLKLYVDNTKTYYTLVKVISGSYTKTNSPNTRIAYDCKYNSGGSTYYRQTPLSTTTTSSQIDVSGTEYITRFRIYQNTSDGTTTFNNFKIQLAVYQGDNTTEWEKYVGGIPSPNPDFPQDINTVRGNNDIVIEGKNLFDMNIYSTTATKSGCTIEITDNAINVTPTQNSYIGSAIKYPTYVNENNRPTCIRVKPNTKYTFSISNSGNSYLCYIDKNYQAINTVDYPLNNLTTYTFTTPSNCKYVMFRLGKNSGTTPYSFEDIQLEENETATTYEAYNGTTYNINLPVENLFDISTDNIGFSESSTISTINNGLKITCTTNGAYRWYAIPLSNTNKLLGKKITITTDMTVSNNQNGQVSLYFVNKNNYSLRTLIGSSGSKSTGKITLSIDVPNSIPSGSTDIGILLYSGINQTSVNDYVNYDNIQIETGSKSNTYTPYGTTPIELCKIGDYQDYITRNTGKNLFDSTNIIVNTSIRNDNGNTYENNNSFSTDYINVDGKNNIAVSGMSNTNGYLWGAFYDRNKTYISGFTNNNYNHIVNIPSNSYYVRLGINNSDLNTLIINYGNTLLPYEPYGKDKWYLHKEIGKVVLDGTTNSFTNRYTTNTNNYYRHVWENASVKNQPGGTIANAYCNKLSPVSIGSTYGCNQGVSINDRNHRIIMYITDIREMTIEQANQWLKTNIIIVYYLLDTPTNTEITYQPLIDQLNALQNAKLFEGTNHITVDTLNEQPSLDIDYFEDSHFSLWSLKTHNYGDFTLDAWDNIDYDLDGTHYLTLNNNTIKYEMSIMSDVESKIPTKQQEVTTNVIGGDDKTNIKIIKTNVDQLNASVNILSQQQTDTQTDVSQLQIDVNGINTTVEHIENVEITGLQSEISSVNQTVSSIANLFQITGGINKIRNSAFLLPDEVWEFTDSGTNPEHTNLGNSYNSTLSGRTISIAEIKARSTKIKSKSENITDLKTDGTKYTFNFYHKQDVDTTTTIKMYSTENNNIKAFNDIVITGQQPFTNYEVSFVPTYTNYTLEIIVANATSIGYAYLYDMMLNSGDKQPWQPASDEIYSTTLQMSRLGLQVYSVGDGTLTILGSDGLTSWETSDGRTKGRLVSKRTVDGDRVKVVTTQSVKLVSDATKTDEELAQEDKWVETTTKVSGKIAKVIYMESGVQ